MSGTPDIKGMVDEYIESVTDERPPDGKYHPSSMFGCDRKTIYEVRGTEPTEDTEAIAKRRFHIGHLLHESVQRTLESHPDIEEVYPEFEVDVPVFNVTGHGDVLIRYKGEWWVTEVKSIKKFAVKMGLPKPDHVKQAVSYWWAVKNHGFKYTDSFGVTATHPPVDVRGILMVYLEKEDLNIYQYNLEPEPWWDTMIPEKVAELEPYFVDDDSLPPRLPRDSKGKKHWLCGYCPFATKCWDVDPAEVKPNVTYEDW